MKSHIGMVEITRSPRAFRKFKRNLQEKVCCAAHTGLLNMFTLVPHCKQKYNLLPVLPPLLRCHPSSWLLPLSSPNCNQYTIYRHSITTPSHASPLFDRRTDIITNAWPSVGLTYWRSHEYAKDITDAVVKFLDDHLVRQPKSVK